MAAGEASAADPSISLTCGSMNLTVQTKEPSTGFTGACLVDGLTYSPQLPSVCFSPKNGTVTYGAGRTTCSAPAAMVARPYSSLAPTYDSYKVLMTCYPHNGSGGCTQGYAVSKSCCDYGMHMVTGKDTSVATGTVFFSPK